ncbi:MAG: hypothetical protein GX589_01820 [Deltaproteobacteria bacterium]|nr:hypothetical protein [Deltaproteobacteria bacterium]
MPKRTFRFNSRKFGVVNQRRIHARLTYFLRLAWLIGHVEAPSRFDHLLAAFRLVFREYLRTGYCCESEGPFRCSLFDFLPNCRKFLYRDYRGNLAGTASLVLDSDAGLPADGVFSKELNDLRLAGCKLAEGTMFAIDSNNPCKFALPLLMASFFRTAQCERVSDIVLIVNPKHVDFYVRVLEFQAISGPKPCPHVANASGVLLRRNISRLSLSDIKSPWARHLVALSMLISSPLPAKLWGKAKMQRFLAEQPWIVATAPAKLQHTFKQAYDLGEESEQSAPAFPLRLDGALVEAAAANS